VRAGQIVSGGRHTWGMRSGIPRNLHELARFQCGVVTRKQVLAAGLSTGVIVSKLKYGRWRQLYRGVYTIFTGPVSREAQLWAAVLYAGKGAELSHETAAELHALVDRPAPLIHVTVPAGRRVRPAPGLVIHLSARARDARFPPGITPHTFVEDTILDLVHAAGQFDDVCGWVTRAFGRRLTGAGPLLATMSQRKKLRWRAELEGLVRAAAGGSHSVLEFRYDRDVERAHGLPPAQRQAPFTKPDGRRGFRDRYYEKSGLVIELDGKEGHPDEKRWIDIGRDNLATTVGGSTLRYGWDDVTRKACEVAAQVAESLRARGWRGRLRPCSPGCRAGHAAGDALSA
jgi:hypothetical protein